MKTASLLAISLAFALLQTPCARAQADADFLSTPEGRSLAESRYGLVCKEEPWLQLVYQALSPALREELLQERADAKEGAGTLGDLFLNTLQVRPGTPCGILCTPDNNRIIQVYDNASGAASLHFIVYTRQGDCTWQKTGNISFLTRYAQFGKVGADDTGVSMEYVDEELGLTIPEHILYSAGTRVITYRSNPEEDRKDSTLTPLTDEVSENNLYHVRMLIEAHRANMTQTDAYGRTPMWHARTPEMQRMLAADTAEERTAAQQQGELPNGDYVERFLATEEGAAFLSRMATHGWEGMGDSVKRTCIERFRMLPPALQKELLEEHADKAGAGLSRLLVETLAKLDLQGGRQVLLFPEDASCIAIQSGHDHSGSRTLAVYARQADGTWRHTTTFTMRSAHATMSDFFLSKDGADITLADPDFGIAFTEHFKFSEKDPERGYRVSPREQGLNTAFNEEVKQGHLRYVHAMLQSGKVNPNDRDINGDTALDCACSAQMTEYLKAHGATQRGRK